MGEGGPKAQSSRHHVNKAWGCNVMYSMVTTVNNAALHIRKLLRESVLKILRTRKHFNHVRLWTLTRRTLVSILQYTHTSNHYVVHLKLT